MNDHRTYAEGWRDGVARAVTPTDVEVLDWIEAESGRHARVAASYSVSSPSTSKEWKRSADCLRRAAECVRMAMDPAHCPDCGHTPGRLGGTCGIDGCACKNAVLHSMERDPPPPTIALHVAALDAEVNRLRGRTANLEANLCAVSDALAALKGGRP